jgi:xanthine dehydrogenase molybdopterin-binding subunit B
MKSDPAFVQSLSLNTFFKFFLTELNKVPGFTLPQKGVSATVKYVRAISTGVELSTPDPTTAPVSQAIPKVEAWIQATGEAKSTNDELMGSNGLYGSFVRSTVASDTITSIDASAALLLPGVVRFISASDLSNLPSGIGSASTPGHNDCGAFPGDEEVSTIDAAIAVNAFFPDNAWQQNTPPLVRGDLAVGFAASARVLTRHSVSQGTSVIRQAVAHALSRPATKVVVKTKRCGGAYGSKLTRSMPIACTTAIAAAVITGRPVKAQCSRTADMDMWGKRPEMSSEYQVGFDDSGEILALNVTFYPQVRAFTV